MSELRQFKIPRIFVVIFAYLVSCYVSGLALESLTFCGLGDCKLLSFGISSIYASDVWNFLGLGLFFALFAFVLTVLPVIFVLYFAEFGGIRRMEFYVAIGATLGLLVTYLPSSTYTSTKLIYCISGAVAGFVYWLIAGRHAGLWREAKA